MEISDVKELLNKGEKVDIECKESDSMLSKSVCGINFEYISH